MAEEKIIRAERIALGIFALVIIVFAIYYMDGCNPPTPTHQNSALEKQKAISEYKRKELTDKLNVLQNLDVKYVDRWRTIKGETKVIVDSVIVMAPDTCTPYLRQMENRLFTERQVADSLLSTKDTIISTYSLIVKEDSVQKAIKDQEIKCYQDSTKIYKGQIKTAKRKGFVKGFIWGFSAGTAVNQGINIINKVK